jgi:hypothetical protein
MQADKTAPAFHLLVELCKMRNRWMVSSAVGIDQDGVCFCQRCVIGPLSVKSVRDANAFPCVFSQTLCQQLYTSIVFMLAGAMARAASDHQYIAFCNICVS